MSDPHRVAALIEARRLERTRTQLQALGVDPADIHAGPFAAPADVSDVGTPAAEPARPGHLLVARAVGAVPGALAAVAITIGAGLAVLPAVTLTLVGAVLGAVAVTGRRDRRPARQRPAEVVHLRHRGDYLRLDARCPRAQAARVQRVLREAGGILLDPPGRTDTPPDGTPRMDPAT